MSRYLAFSIPGSMETWQGVDYEIGILGIAGAVTRLKMTLSSGADGDDFACDLRDAADGGGSGMTFTIANGETTAAEVTAPQLAVSATETLYLRVTEAAGADSLTGWLEFDPTGTEEVTTFLTTLTRVKTDGKISDDHDAQLSRLIQGISAAMQSWIGRTIVDTEYADEAHSGDGWTHELKLNHWPVTSTTTFAITDSDDAVSSSDYEVDNESGIVVLKSGAWTSGRRNLKVTYSAGYTAIPEDLAMAATRQVIEEFNKSPQSGKGKLGLEGSTDAAGGAATFLPDGFLPFVETIMERYRRKC
jgi:hypothetical protein